MDKYNEHSHVLRPPSVHYGLPAHIFRSRVAELKAWFRYDQNIGPSKAPPLSRETLIQSQLSSRQDQLETSQWVYQTRTTIVGSRKHSSRTSLDHLSPILISDMLVRKTHKGQFLICRSIAPCARIVGVQLVVEDAEGATSGMSIYNFPTAASGTISDVDMLFPVGVTMAIREPTFKIATQGLYPIIRVDSPSDIIFLGSENKIMNSIEWKSGSRVEGSPVYPVTAQEWKNQGNLHFEAKQWLPAAVAYSKGIILDPAAYIIHLNRSEAYLRLEYYAAARADAEYVLNLPDIPSELRKKALCRASKACYGMNDYVSAESVLTEWYLLDPGNAEALQGVLRVQKRLQESCFGQYDWAQLFSDSQLSPRVDAADFVGHLEVKSAPGRGGGRGVFATQSIDIGDLLVVSKAFVSVFSQDISPSQEFRTFNLITDRVQTKCQAAVPPRVISKIYGNPELYPCVSTLFSGPNHEIPPSYSINPDRSLKLQDPLVSSVDIDVEQIEAICTYNSFSPNSLRALHMTSPKEREHATDAAPSALYLLPSLFNHACASNANWHCFGDLMVIRATEHIACGQEIHLPYISSITHATRLKNLKQHLIDQCECSLCQDDRLDGDASLELRDELGSQIDEDGECSLQKARSVADQIMATYSASRGPVRPLMGLAYHKIAGLLRQAGHSDTETISYSKAAIEEDFRALECFGFVIKDSSMSGPVSDDAELPVSTDRLPMTYAHETFVAIMIMIALSFSLLDDHRRVTRWLRAALWVEKIAIGADKALFWLRYGSRFENTPFKTMLAAA